MKVIQGAAVPLTSNRMAARIPVIASMMCVLLTQAVAAQEEIGSASETRRFCTAAAAIVARPASEIALRRAVLDVQSCPEHAPRSLAALWASQPTDSATVAILAGVTGHVRDRQLLAAVRDVASDEKAVRTTRLAALSALVSLYDPRLTAHFVPYPGSAVPRVLLAQLNHDPSPIASDPLSSADVRGIPALLGQLGASASDSVVRSLAASLAGSLKAREP